MEKMEIALRVQFVSEPDAEAPVMIRGPQDVATLMKDRLKDSALEELWIITMDTRGYTTGRFMASRGGLTSSIVEPRTVFTYALSRMAAAVVLVHNHPSGNPEPSIEDTLITKQVAAAGKILGIPLRDHVILANGNWTSLAERGVI